MEPKQGFYIPVGHAAGQGQNLELALVREILGPIMADSTLPKYAHNADYDMVVLAEHGMPVAGLTFDTMVAAFISRPKRRGLGLKQLAWERLGVEMTPIEDLIGSGRNQVTMDQVAISKAAPYAAADADMTLRLTALLHDDLVEKEQLPLYRDVEIPLIPVLVEMERCGVALDVEYLGEMSAKLAEQLAELEDQLFEFAGHPFNVNSPMQLSEVLFEEIGLNPPKRTKTGYSTDASVMETLQGEHPIIDYIVDYRELSKLKSTYVDSLSELCDPQTGRVHTSYKQTGVVTGRLSSVNPNLQNIPIRSDVGRQVRRAFVAAPGSWLLEADYSQVELRVLAHMSEDPALKNAFWRGEDIHASTAAAILDIPIKEVTPDQRRVAKSINFGIVYGMSGFGLARRTDLSIEEANRFIESYFQRYPKVSEYLEATKTRAREKGYVETLLGRRRYFPELEWGSQANRRVRASAERMAINMPIQGTAADIMKLAMIKMADVMRQRGLESKMILQVHDELGFEVPDSELDTMRQLVRQVMEDIYPLSVPLKVEMQVGRDWYNMEACE
jgi:DNA polymerase-1